MKELLWCLLVVFVVVTCASAQESVADAARRLQREKESAPKSAQAKRVYTMDDFGASPSSTGSQSLGNRRGGSQTASDPKGALEHARHVFQQMNRFTDKQAIEFALGKDADIMFPNRDRWEWKFLAAWRRYLSNAEQCVSTRASEREESKAGCSRLTLAEWEWDTLIREGQKLAAEWKARQ